MREMGLAKIYRYTKFEVGLSSFTHSRLTEDAWFKIQKFDPDSDHTPFGGFLSFMRWDMPRSIVNRI